MRNAKIASGRRFELASAKSHGALALCACTGIVTGNGSGPDQGIAGSGPEGAPTVGPDSNSAVRPAVNTAMVGLAAMALACDCTRVIAFNYSLPAAHIYYRGLGSNMNADFHNTICHGDDGTSSSQPRVNTGVMYTMQCFAEFLTALQGVPEGAGTLLDNSLVYATSCTSWGKVHTTNEWPVLLAGKAGGQLVGNQHFRKASGNLSQVLMTVGNAMGANLKEIGLDSGHVASELSGLRVGT
ncbi:MAG: hypothetical protein ABI548_06220 [Polyangiaceae bacterium]